VQPLELNTATISAHVGTFGGGIKNDGTTNSIIANPLNDVDCVNSNTLNADSSNIDSDGTCDNASTLGSLNLGPLQGNGGPTDQRGEPRTLSVTSARLRYLLKSV